MRLVHVAFGWSIVVAFGVLWPWGLGAWLIRRGPGRPVWGVVAFVQVMIIVQGLAGLVLLILGRSATPLHYVYGVVFPLLLLLVAHVVARDERIAHRPWLPFTAAAFFCFGLTLRALMTGFGLP